MSLDHLFFTFGKEVIMKWTKNLKIFRLCSMYPYPNDFKPVRFLMAIHFEDSSDLKEILHKLNYEIDMTKPEESRFKEYNENHSAGWIILQDNFCYMDINKITKKIFIEVSGIEEDLFKMDNSVFIRAKKIEQFIEKLGFNFIDPPQDDRYCISPKYYPSLWN